MAAMVRVVAAYCGDCGREFVGHGLAGEMPFEIPAELARITKGCSYCGSGNTLITTEPVKETPCENC